MSRPILPGVVRELRQFTAGDDTSTPSDGQLVQAFVAARDEAAFELLLQRHGPMVLGVCLRILQHPQDAEDAFQATFLVLARKAASIQPPEKVGNWLYGVAYRTARKAQTAAARRRAHEGRASPMNAAQERDTDFWLDLQPILDAELSRLPECYRLPIILCDMEGRSRQEVARHLGWSEGTLSGRLARARVLLAQRLSRRGITMTTSTLGGWFAVQSAVAACAPALIGAVLTFAVSDTGATASTAALAQNTIRALVLERIARDLLLLLLVGVLAWGGLFLASNPGNKLPQENSPRARSKDPAVAAAEEKVHSLPARKAGLSLTVEFARKVFHIRERVDLTFHLKNELPRALYIGDGFLGPHYHETGPARHFELRVQANGKVPLHFWSGTMTEGETSGLRRVFLLQPGETYSGKIRLSAGRANDTGYSWRPHEIRGGSFENVATGKRHAFGVDAKKYRVVLRYQVKPETHGVWEPPAAFKKELLWEDVLDSQPVDIEITEKAPARKKIRQVESRPVQEKDLEFVVVADEVWVLPEPDGVRDVALGLRVTNRGQKVQVLDQFDDLRVLLTTADGQELPFRGVPRGVIPSEAVQLAPGESILLNRPAQLEWVHSWNPKKSTLYFGGSDGVDRSWSAGAQENLTAGKYSLKMSYASVHPERTGAWNLTTEPVQIEVRAGR